jgi:hypothetical protein
MTTVAATRNHQVDLTDHSLVHSAEQVRRKTRPVETSPRTAFGFDVNVAPVI